MLTLCGIAIVVAGFVAGSNPLLVVTVAAAATRLAAGLDPVIGLLERAALLDLPDHNGVIPAQAPTALILLLGNIALMYLLAFPR